MDFNSVGTVVVWAAEVWETASISPACPYRGSDPGAKECRQCVSSSYFPGGHPSYECERFRWMYLWSYSPTNVYSMWHLLRSHSQAVRRSLGAERLEDGLAVTSLGCGPGCDLLGFFAWLEDEVLAHNCLELTSLRAVDRMAEWLPMVKPVIDKYYQSSEGPKLEYAVDVQQVSDARTARLRKHDDMLLMSRVWSELGYSLEDGVAFLGDLVTASPSLRLMAFVDRTDTATVDLIDEVVDAIPCLTKLHSGTCNDNCRVDIPDEIKARACPQWNCNHSQWLVQVDRP